MAITYTQYTGDGARTTYPVDFGLGYLEQDDVCVYQGDDHTVQLAYTWQGDSSIELSSPIPVGETLRVRRVVDRNKPINDYTTGARLGKDNLNLSFRQALMITEEIADGFMSATNVLSATDLSMTEHKIIGLADGVEDTDATTLGQIPAEVLDTISSMPAIGILNMGGYNITELAAAVEATDAVPLGQLPSEVTRMLSLASTVQADVPMNGNTITGIRAAVVASEAVALGQVQQIIQDVLDRDEATPANIPFNTVSDAKAAILREGEAVTTLGYHTVNDGGGADYVVVAGATGVDDGGSYHNMSNGNQLELLVDSLGIRLSVFGINSSLPDVYDGLLKANTFSVLLGMPVLFKPGETYTSLSNLNFTKSINWEASDGSGKTPLLRILESGGVGVKVKGQLISTTTLSSSIDIWDDTVNVGSTTGVAVGDLLSILSDTPFYGVPVARQDTIKKGHLMRVSEIVSGTQVRLETAVNDTYDIGSEAVSIEFHSPINYCTILGIHITKGFLQSSEVCVEFEYCYKPVIKNSAISGARGYGVEFDRCYKGGAFDCSGQDAVQYYQFRNNGSHGVIFENLKTTRTTKAVDLSGLSIPSRDAIVRGCIDDHGGVDALGASLFKKGTGFGSHWGVDNANFYDCTTRDRYRGFYQRGLAESYHNCSVTGAVAQSPYQLENPHDVVLDTCTYNSELIPNKGSGISDYVKNLTNSDIANIPPSFCVVVNTDGSNVCKGFSIKGCRGYGVNRRFLDLATAGVEYSDFEVTDNYAYVVNTGASNDISVVDSRDLTSMVYNAIIDRNDLQTDDAQTNVYELGVNLSTAIKIKTQVPSILQGGKTYLVNLDVDSVVTLHAGIRGDGVEVSARVAGVSGFYGAGVIYRNGVFDSFGSSNFFVENSYMTGTTGPSNSLNVSFTGSRVYVENRTGVKASILVTITSPL